MPIYHVGMSRLTCPAFLSLLSCHSCLMVVLSQLSCPVMFRPGSAVLSCHVPTFLKYTSFHGCPVTIVLPRLSCLGCPVLTVLSCCLIPAVQSLVSGPDCPVLSICPVPDVLSGCPVLTCMSLMSCSCRPVLSVQSTHLSQLPHPHYPAMALLSCQSCPV
jgi:hypothetical protein